MSFYIVSQSITFSRSIEDRVIMHIAILQKNLTRFFEENEKRKCHDFRLINAMMRVALFCRDKGRCGADEGPCACPRWDVTHLLHGIATNLFATKTSTALGWLYTLPEKIFFDILFPALRLMWLRAPIL